VFFLSTPKLCAPLLRWYIGILKGKHQLLSFDNEPLTLFAHSPTDSYDARMRDDILEHVKAQGCPKVLVATHFHELFKYDMITETKLVSLFKMEILSRVQNDGEQILYLYKYVSFYTFCGIRNVYVYVSLFSVLEHAIMCFNAPVRITSASVRGNRCRRKDDCEGERGRWEVR